MENMQHLEKENKLLVETNSRLSELRSKEIKKYIGKEPKTIELLINQSSNVLGKDIDDLFNTCNVSKSNLNCCLDLDSVNFISVKNEFLKSKENFFGSKEELSDSKKLDKKKEFELELSEYTNSDKVSIKEKFEELEKRELEKIKIRNKRMEERMEKKKAKKKIISEEFDVEEEEESTRSTFPKYNINLKKEKEREMEKESEKEKESKREMKRELKKKKAKEILSDKNKVLEKEELVVDEDFNLNYDKRGNLKVDKKIIDQKQKEFDSFMNNIYH